MNRIRILSCIILLIFSSNSAAIDSQERRGISFPGFEPVTISLAGLRSIGFGDPVSLITNPSAISPKLGANIYSVSYGPVFTTTSFSDASGDHDESWIEALDSKSLGMRFDVLEYLSVGIGVAGKSQLPFETVYYVPENDKAEGDMMEVEGSSAEVALGGAWTATDWLVVGGALGIRVYKQTYDITYGGAAGSVTALEYQWTETCFNCGISVPLEGVTIGLCWNSPSDYTCGVIAAGGMVNISSGLSAGGELEMTDAREKTVYTGRVFCISRPFDALTLRAGTYLTSHSDEISREGLGISGGAGYTIGNVEINTGFSWSALKGNRDIYGYDSLESYESNSYILSLGVTYSGYGDTLQERD